MEDIKNKAQQTNAEPKKSKYKIYATHPPIDFERIREQVEKRMLSP